MDYGVSDSTGERMSEPFKHYSNPGHFSSAIWVTGLGFSVATWAIEIRSRPAAKCSVGFIRIRV